MHQDRPGPADNLADRVWSLLLRLTFERVHQHVDAAAAELELATSQAIALSELEDERPISMRELAARLQCHPSNITGLVDRLEARGLVERRPDGRDRRVKGLALTAKGEQIRSTLARRLREAPPCVSCLPEADQRMLHDLLVRVLEAR
ncbi:MAG TPA: MarR family transcriptional regulator [Chloroflexota bacterium]|nr:MarR family transcriptional regulator [Chloroflexota bacterium]